MQDIPEDMIEAAARYDEAWPIRDDIADRPWRVEVWVPCGDEAAREVVESMRVALEHGVVPTEPLMEGKWRAWFRTCEEANTATASSLVMRDIVGPPEADGRLHKVVVAEYLLADGRRHLHVRDDWDPYFDNDGIRYVWHEGNWSCDCNRAIDLAFDDVEVPVHVGEDCMPEDMDRPWIGLGRLLVRTRSRVTGEVSLEMFDPPEVEG